MSGRSTRQAALVMGVQIDALTWAEAVDRLLGWARTRKSRNVAVCNVHVVVSASRDTAYRDVINNADMALPDGAPIAWMLRRLGFAGQPRISGPDLMLKLCSRCAEESLPVYFYGGMETTLAALHEQLRASLPSLKIGGMEAPLLGSIKEEDAGLVARINGSGAGIVFVGLGCPRQERWIAEHRGRVNAVMIGVGAAFDYHAGTIRRAPEWMQNAGLEWLHRLGSEPRRLWKRYLITNTLFLIYVARQLLAKKRINS